MGNVNNIGHWQSLQQQMTDVSSFHNPRRFTAIAEGFRSGHHKAAPRPAQGKRKASSSSDGHGRDLSCHLD